MNSFVQYFCSKTIVVDEAIYPREKIDHNRMAIFAENIRDDFSFDPIELKVHPEKKGKSAKPLDDQDEL